MGTTATSAQLDKVFGLLASDSAFRERLLGDPVGAMAEHGIQIDPSEVPAVRRLPSKEDASALSEAMKEKLAPQPCLILFAQIT